MKKYGLKLMDGVLIIMISEIDIRDWDKVDFDNILRAAKEKDINQAYALLYMVATAAQEVYKKQTRHIPALERK